MKFLFQTGLAVLGLAVGVLSAGAKDADPATTNSEPHRVTTDPAHVLQLQDKLCVKVLGEEDINDQCKQLEVSQNLTVSLPLIGTVEVKGLTVGQLQETIRRRYDRDFLVNPQVNVLVVQYAERSVNVVGSVTKQGRIEFPELRELSIVDAIALAGGQTRLADLVHVKLTRADENGQSTTTTVDVGAMMKKGGVASLLLQPGDVVYIPERVI